MLSLKFRRKKYWTQTESGKHMMKSSLLKQVAVAVLLVFSTTTFALADEPVKKSNTGICHAPGSTYYAQTKHFTPYKTLQECLKSGGRMPKRWFDEQTDFDIRSIRILFISFVVSCNRQS